MGPSEEPRQEAWQTGPNPTPGGYGARASVPPSSAGSHGGTSHGDQGPDPSTHGGRGHDQPPGNTKQRAQAAELLRAFKGEVAPGPKQWQDVGIQFLYRRQKGLVRG